MQKAFQGQTNNFAVDGHSTQMSKSQRIKDVIKLCLKLLIYKYVVENPTIAIVISLRDQMICEQEGCVGTLLSTRALGLTTRYLF